MKEDHEAVELASELFRRAYECQMSGRLEEAIDLYKESIDVYPTAEAYTFLGWTYSFQGRLDDAIEECKKAIQVDPEFGNPYNDIGAYMIEQELYDEAVPWLKKAIEAKRYESYHFAHYNLGRAYAAQGMVNWAQEEFKKAIHLAPDYGLAIDALQGLRRQIN